jgi:hypothetical protein
MSVGGSHEILLTYVAVYLQDEPLVRRREAPKVPIKPAKVG